MIQNGQNQINNFPQNNQISQSQPIPNGQNIQNQNNNEINKPLSNSYQNTNNIIKNIDNNLDSNKNKENQKSNGQELNKNIIGNEMSIEYENALREQIELSTPLISEQLNINILLEDYKNNFIQIQ